MKKLCMLMLLCVLAGQAMAADSKSVMYDRYGNRLGETRTRGSETNVYDNYGNYTGKIVSKPDGSSSTYDTRGNYRGGSTKSATTQKK